MPRRRSSAPRHRRTTPGSRALVPPAADRAPMPGSEGRASRAGVWPGPYPVRSPRSTNPPGDQPAPEGRQRHALVVSAGRGRTPRRPRRRQHDTHPARSSPRAVSTAWPRVFPIDSPPRGSGRLTERTTASPCRRPSPWRSAQNNAARIGSYGAAWPCVNALEPSAMPIAARRMALRRRRPSIRTPSSADRTDRRRPGGQPHDHVRTA
jgi:hypothetical protein